VEEGTFGYDGASRLSTVTSESQSAAYTYLANSSLLDNIAFKQGGTTTMTLTKTTDTLNRPGSISMASQAAGTQTYTYGYNNAGERSQMTQEDGSYWAYGYDGREEVTSGTKNLSGGAPVPGYQFGYGFDGIGNRLSTTANGRNASYSPNAVNEHATRTVPGYVTVLGSANPQTAITVNGQTASRQNGGTYDRELAVNNAQSPAYLRTIVAGVLNGQTSQELGHVFIPATPESYSYDDDGNLKSDGRWTYGWDGENRLVSMETNIAAAVAGAPREKISFSYDYLGRRISKAVSKWSGGELYSSSNISLCIRWLEFGSGNAFRWARSP